MQLHRLRDEYIVPVLLLIVLLFKYLAFVTLMIFFHLVELFIELCEVLIVISELLIKTKVLNLFFGNSLLFFVASVYQLLNVPVYLVSCCR